MITASVCYHKWVRSSTMIFSVKNPYLSRFLRMKTPILVDSLGWRTSHSLPLLQGKSKKPQKFVYGLFCRGVPEPFSYSFLWMRWSNGSLKPPLSVCFGLPLVAKRPLFLKRLRLIEKETKGGVTSYLYRKAPATISQVHEASLAALPARHFTSWRAPHSRPWWIWKEVSSILAL